MSGRAEAEHHRGGAAGDNDVSWPLAVVSGTGFGLAVTFVHLGLLVPMAVTLAAMVVVLVAMRPRVFSLGNSGYESVDIRSDDFPRWRHWSPFLPPALTFLSGYALDPLPVGPVVGGAVYAGAASLAFTWSIRRTGQQFRGVGQRRARKILADPGLEGITVERLDAAGAHRGLMRVLLEVGAVDGQRIRLWKLGEVTATEPAGLLPELRELRRHDLVGISTIDAGDDVARQLVELTPLGVRVLAQERRR